LQQISISVCSSERVRLRDDTEEGRFRPTYCILSGVLKSLNPDIVKSDHKLGKSGRSEAGCRYPTAYMCHIRPIVLQIHFQHDCSAELVASLLVLADKSCCHISSNIIDQVTQKLLTWTNECDANSVLSTFQLKHLVLDFYNLHCIARSIKIEAI